METGITKLAEYGSVGIAISLVLLIWWVVKNNTDREDKLTSIIGNHLEHQTEATAALCVAIKELSTIIREKIK